MIVAVSGHADSLERLVKAARAGDREAQEEILSRHLPVLRAYVRLNAHGPLRVEESCSDLVQSTCREVLGSLERLEYRGEAAFRGWLCSCALHKIRERQRYYAAEKRAPNRVVSGAESLADIAVAYSAFSPSKAAIANERVAEIEAAFDELPEGYREIIAMSRIAGLPHAEIAERLGKSPAAVRTTLNRALCRLAALLEPAPSE